jgi:predicted TIM-barrel fold metal-dependent hydrolase
MVIDVHAHAFPDKLAPRAMDTLARRAGLPLPAIDGTVSGLSASMTAAGIDRCWVANIATRPEQASAILEWSKRIRSDAILPLGSLHPDSPDWETELDKIVDAGLLGLKFHPQYQDFALDEPRLIPLFRTIASRGLFVLVHAGYDLAFPGDERAAPARLATLHRQVPELTMIAAHLGGYRAWDEVIEYLVGSEVYFDTSFMMEATTLQRADIFRHHDRSRILFGSDCPWTRQQDSLEQVLALPLDAESKARILGGNAEQLLRGLDGVRRGPHAQVAIG